MTTKTNTLQELYWHKESLLDAEWRISRRIRALAVQGKRFCNLLTRRDEVAAQIDGTAALMRIIENGGVAA